MRFLIRKRCIEAIKRSPWSISAYIRHIIRNALILDVIDYNTRVRVDSGKLDKGLRQKLLSMGKGSISRYIDMKIEEKMREEGYWK